MKRLYLWAQFPTAGETATGLKNGVLSEIQAHCINFKRPMLNEAAFWGVSLLCFAIWVYYEIRLNALALQRDADTPANTPYWIKRFENVSGPGILIYAITMTACAIYWVMSMDPTWFSSVYGLLFLVGQGYLVLAFCIIVTISLSRAEPFKTILEEENLRSHRRPPSSAG